MNQIAKNLLKAADVLEKGGVVAGTRDDGYGRHCAIGAIEVVTNYRIEQTVKRLVEILDLRAAPDRYNIGRSQDSTGKLAAWFNNLVDEGKGDFAIAEFRRAAKIAEQDAG